MSLRVPTFRNASEFEFQRECEGIRNIGGADGTRDYIKADPTDIGLITSVPQSESCISDKTQRINLGWLSERFRRKHYQPAYVSANFQAADSLTKPFTSIKKWNKALRLTSISDYKSSARMSGASRAAPPANPSVAASRPLSD